MRSGNLPFPAQDQPMLPSATAQTTIAFLTDSLGMGGSERQLYLLLKYLDRTRFDCHVIAMNPLYTFFEKPLAELGICTWRLSASSDSRWRRLRELFALVRHIQPDVLQAWALHLNPYAAVVGRMAGVPIRLGSQRSAYVGELVQDLPRAYRWLAFYGVERVMVNSETALAQTVADGHPASRLTLLPNAVELPEAQSPLTDEALAALGLHPERRIVGIVGNLRPEKNHEMFIRAMGEVLSEFEDVQAAIVGSAVARHKKLPSRLEALITEKGLEGRLILTGFCDRIPALMKRLSVLCLSSEYEGLPNVILEAMAAGRPVVATRVGGVPELVEDGVNGFLVPRGDATAMAAAVRRLLEQPQMAAEMGAASRMLLQEKHACEHVASRYTSLITESGI